MSKVIGNIGLLDLTTATEEKVKSFDKIGNVGMLIYTPSTFKFVSMLDMGNVGSSVEVPEGYKLVSTGKFNLDNAFLNSLEASSKLIFLGKLNIIDDISLSLFEEKIKNIIVMGKVLINEEYLDAFNRKVTAQTGCKVEVIPSGYSYISQDLFLDSLSITRFDQAKLFVAGRLQIDEDLTVEELNNHILKLKVKDLVICKRDLKKPVFKLCEDVNTKIYDYTGKIHIIDTHYRLSESVLKYITDNICFMVNGELEIDENVSAEAFLQKIEKIYLFGRITCSEEQHGFIQSKLVESMGTFFIKGKDEKKDSDDSHSHGAEKLSNFGYLKI